MVSPTHSIFLSFLSHTSDVLPMVFNRRRASFVTNFTLLSSFLKLQGQLLQLAVWRISIGYGKSNYSLFYLLNVKFITSLPQALKG